MRESGYFQSRRFLEKKVQILIKNRFITQKSNVAVDQQNKVYFIQFIKENHIQDTSLLMANF